MSFLVVKSIKIHDIVVCKIHSSADRCRPIIDMRIFEDMVPTIRERLPHLSFSTVYGTGIFRFDKKR